MQIGNASSGITAEAPSGVDEAPVRVEIPPGVTPMKTSLLMACWVCWIGLATAAEQVEPVKSSPVPAAQPAVAASTNPAPAMPEGFHVANGSPRSALTESLVNRLARELGTESVEPPQRPNEVTVGGRRYSGILVQLIRSPQPLQLLNPWAPPEAGPGEQNLVRDPVTGAASGLKLLAINF